MEFKIENTNVYGLEFAVKASGNPMRTVLDKSEVTEKDMLRATKLGSCKGGEGHDNFLKGVIVQFDVTAPKEMIDKIRPFVNPTRTSLKTILAIFLRDKSSSINPLIVTARD